MALRVGFEQGFPGFRSVLEAEAEAEAEEEGEEAWDSAGEARRSRPTSANLGQPRLIAANLAGGAGEGRAQEGGLG